ncbi:MAG: fatty-acid--CoA ligase [Sulfurospirillum sp.]|nr:fatty-acid--CoA ligase [Sulfurospirillum sp.]MBL0702590.1 fatty-acid--CoA ligase [Sulfurospirillum sp.]
MGIKRYILLTVVYMLAIGLYVHSFSGESHTLSVHKFSLTLPISLWIILPIFFLFIASTIHMTYYSLKDFLKHRATNKDFESFKTALSEKVMGEDSAVKYRTDRFKFIGKSIKMMSYKSTKNFDSGDEKIELNRQVVEKLEDGDVLELKKYRLSFGNKLLEQNNFNKLTQDKKYALEILENCTDENNELCKKAYFEYIQYASFEDIKKIGFTPTKEMFIVLMERYLEEEGRVNISLDLESIQDLLMQFKANREDYLELAYEIKVKLDPDALIALFEKLYNSPDHTAVADAYLYVLYELQMIDKIRDILENSDKDEFMKWKTILFLREHGKNVDSGLFLRI